MSLPIVVALSVVGALLATALVLALRSPEASKRRVEALFRRPSKAPKAPPPDHYYRPYWS
jgi:hypothetical protein